MNTQIQAFNGIEIEYCLHYNKADKKPLLVFLNGAGRDLNDWEGVIKALDKTVSFLCFNRPGCGKSAQASFPQTAESVFELLKTMLSTLSISSETPIFFITHSFGSLIAQFAIKEKAFPIFGALFIEPTTQKDVEFVFNKQFYVSQNTFSEADNVQTSIKQISADNLNCSNISVIIGTKLNFAEYINLCSYRRKHIAFIKEFALSNNARISYAQNSHHFPMRDDLELVNSEIEKLMKSIC